jgi:hypothetical protein
MGCGCRGSSNASLSKPVLQRPDQAPRQAMAPQPPSVLNATATSNVAQAVPSSPVPVVQTPAPAVQQARITSPVQQHPPPQPPPRQVTSTNGDTIREAMRRKREALMAQHIGSKSRQY